jgi:hypothetical protein
MRELERDLSSDLPPCPRLAVIGRGRLGSAITAALSARPGEVALLSPTPLGRDSAPAALETADAILLCVPDGQIAAAAARLPRGRRLAERLALALELRPVEVSDDARAAYHAAASIASNFLVTLEAAAEQLAATAGVGRELLVPLVQATVENWAALGGEQALTGPVARGDELTVARQRAAVSERAPELLALFDALVERTRALAAGAAARAGTGQAA